MPEPNDSSMQDLKPTVWIGKQGCTETMIDEIVTQLKKRTLIKVKWLQNTEVDPAAIAAQARARLVEVRGRTMVLAEKGKAGKTTAVSPARVTARESAKPAAARGRRPPANAVKTEPRQSRRRQTGAMARSRK